MTGTGGTSIGIDLGTTYSCVIHRAPDGTEELIPSAAGEDLTPSVVFFDPDGSVLVGKAARKMLADDPEDVVVGIKRHMGHDHPLEFHGRVFTPEAISGIILRRLAMDAAAHLHVGTDQVQAVVTVPAYFGVAEKESTHAAARIAGLACLEIIAEPVAAAYAYGADPADTTSSLVFDLGGGTFDVAVVGMVHGRPRIWAVDGEAQLGGLDWDRRLENTLWQKLLTQGIDPDALLEEEFQATFAGEAEILKRSLTIHEQGVVHIRHGGASYSVGVTRAAFEQATSDLLMQCIEATLRVVAAARTLGSAPVARVLMVGGSTRMPMVRGALEEALSLPVLIHDPDKAVARGAALLADSLSRSRGMTERIGWGSGPVQRISTVLPRAIGITIHSSDPARVGRVYVRNVIPENTVLPVERAEVTVATILDNQMSARVELCEQAGPVRSEDPASNTVVFDGEVTGLAPAPAGRPVRLYVSVDSGGRISVSAEDGATGRPVGIEAFIHGVIDDHELDEQIDNVSNLLMVM